VIRLTINTDSLEATVGVEPDGRVFQGSTLLFTDVGFLERHLAEKARMLRDARSRMLRERFGRTNKRSASGNGKGGDGHANTISEAES